MYTTWMLCLAKNDHVAAGLSLGICICLIAGSGWSKICIGGTAKWGHSSTLGTILKEYHSYSLANYGPLFPSLNRWFRHHPWTITLLGTSTLFFECLVVPLSLCVSSEWRYCVMAASVGMHIGIGLLQSFIIGVAFLPNIAAYYFGFCSTGISTSSDAWIAAGAVVVAWSGATLLWNLPSCIGTPGGGGRQQCRLLPEDWPCTPFALFAWNGRQWNVLFSRFVKLDRRLVVYNNAATKSSDLVGCEIVPRCWSRMEYKNNKRNLGMHTKTTCTRQVHNGWELLAGETFCHPVVLEQLNLHGSEVVEEEWDGKEFVVQVSMWMEKSQRFVAIDSGTVMNRVAYVIVESNTVVKVLAEM